MHVDRDTASILSADSSPEEVVYPILPILPPMDSTGEHWSPLSALPSPFLSDRNTAFAPANISRRRVPIAECLTRSAARPGRAAQVQSIFQEDKQPSANRFLGAADPVRTIENERRLCKRDARDAYSASPNLTNKDLAVITPSSAKRITGHKIPKLVGTPCEVKPRTATR
jgi:hypothetical protein